MMVMMMMAITPRKASPRLAHSGLPRSKTLPLAGCGNRQPEDHKENGELFHERASSLHDRPRLADAAKNHSRRMPVAMVMDRTGAGHLPAPGGRPHDKASEHHEQGVHAILSTA
jgi:hypothetical protein